MAEVHGRRGRIRWRHFLAIFVVGLAGASALVLGMARGALAVSFAVASTPVKVSADLLRGFGFVAYGVVDRELNGTPHPVVVNGFRKLFLNGFCQSIVTPHVPLIGDVTLRVTAPAVESENSVADLAFIAGDVTYEHIEVNIDASIVTAGPPGARGVPGTSGTQAAAVVVRNLREVQWASTAGRLHLSGMVTTVLPGRHECF
ncbi:DUF6230 family protein [Gandjariella thermophila]|uniref:Cholesterol esterase n=1 Tax=Gandjariella thermophila TaxID=1931992 RepID=A0A4D4JFR5_9PSEU|nr:DUF6230 family protein [Gandjariella thermophila]GDY32737.1 cholesterol esterase [Gandjariella thermophila]